MVERWVVPSVKTVLGRIMSGRTISWQIEPTMAVH